MAQYNYGIIGNNNSENIFGNTIGYNETDKLNKLKNQDSRPSVNFCVVIALDEEWETFSEMKKFIVINWNKEKKKKIILYYSLLF